jgi:hypothetical protein
MNLQDFIKGIDFTAYVTQTAAMHSILVDSGTPFTDKGLVMQSTDTALSTPDVPNPLASADYHKWKRYIWIRVPHSTDTNTVPWLYLWNDNATSVATYLKWQRVQSDTTTIENLITNIQTDITNIETRLDAVELTVNNAQSQAAQAALDAAAALALVAAAAARADEAYELAETANERANAAYALAEAANTLATTAKNTADTVAAQIAALQIVVTNATKSYTTTPLVLTTIAGAGKYVEEAHSIGAIPKKVRAVIACITNDGTSNYVVGDEIAMDFVFTNGTDYPAFNVMVNATTVIFKTFNSGASAWRVIDKTSNSRVALTLANWVLKIYVEA